MENDIKIVCDLLRESKWAIALTGAGISVDSNIPDFRSSGGLWERFPPEEYATIEAFIKNPQKVWKLFHAMEELLKSAKPNKGHFALAELEKMAILKSIITQNIDNLHQKAGSKEVIEFHGSALYSSCIECSRKILSENLSFKEDGVPYCECGGVMKPDVVLFGERIPEDALMRAFAEASKCDVVLVCGTSAVVAPASMIPIVAKENGSKVFEFNKEKTAISHFVYAGFYESTSLSLPKIVECLKNKTNLCI